MTCPVCGADDPVDKRFCGDCGSLLAARAQPPSVPPVEAGEAGERLEADSERPRTLVGARVPAGIATADRDLPDERRLVTALFADISGFTALAQQVDAEDLLEIVDPIVARLTSVAGRNGAYVEKFAGDALLAVFGAPTAHEDDAERALLTAMEMHQELGRVRHELPSPARDLGLHIGVSSGHGIARIIGSEARVDYGVLGDAVILAQRLESHAPPGETYVGEATVALARDRFVFEPIAPLAVKGRDTPVPAWRLLGRAAGIPTVAGARPPELVGRDAELRALKGLVVRLGSPTGVVAVVSGEPGAGKTTLLDAFRRRLKAGPLRVLSTRCLSYGATLPYHPWAGLVRAEAGIDPDDPPGRVGAALAASLAGEGASILPYLARLAGVPAAPGGSDDATDAAARLEPEALKRALHDAFCDWLLRQGRGRSIALLVEDVQWIDAASLDLLRDVAGRAGRSPLLLCLTTRPEGVEIAASVIARGVAGGSRRLDLALAPLPLADVEGLVRRLLGGEPPDLLARALADRTGGNPYFVTESVRALREAGTLAADAGGWRLARDWEIDAVPETIEEILGARIDRLSPGTAHLLQEASIIGRWIRRPLLRAIADEPESLDERIVELVAGGFLDRPQEEAGEVLAFHHALVQDVAYGRLLRRQRRELHLRTADAVEALYGSGDDAIDLLARHLYLAHAGARAIVALVRSAAKARGLFANDEAILGFARAVEIARTTPDAFEQLPEILLSLGDLHDLRGDYEQAAVLYAEVRTSANDLRAWRGLATVRRRQGSYAEALGLLDEAERELPPEADRREIHLERASTLLFAGRFAEAARAAEAGLALAGIGVTETGLAESGATATLAETADRTTGRLILELAAAEHQRRAPESQDAALRNARTAEAILRRFDDVRGIVVALRTTGSAEWLRGRPEEAATILEGALRLAERTGGVEEIGGTLIDLGVVRLALGQPGLALEADRRAIAEFERVGHASGRMIATANMAEALVAAGELDGALASADDALRLAAELDDPTTTADVTLTIARERLRRGDHVGAIERAEDAARRFLELGEPSTAADALRLGVEAARASGSEERTRALEARIRSLEDPGGADLPPRRD